MKFPAANNYCSEKEKSHHSPVSKFSSIVLLSPPFPSHSLDLLLSTKSKSFNTCWLKSSSFWGCLHISRWGNSLGILLEQPRGSSGASVGFSPKETWPPQLPRQFCAKQVCPRCDVASFISFFHGESAKLVSREENTVCQPEMGFLG